MKLLELVQSVESSVPRCSDFQAFKGTGNADLTLAS